MTIKINAREDNGDMKSDVTMFYHGSECILEIIDMPNVPRVGEYMVVQGIVYKVTDVYYTPEDFEIIVFLGVK